jgi:hypothetical protein
MMTMENYSKVRKIFLLVPALFAAVLMGFMFLSCDVGDEPDPPTGPDTVYDPDFDETRPGINVRINPNRVTVPDPVTGGDNDDIVVQAWYRDPAGMAVQGVQMNFKAEPPPSTTSASYFSFYPPATLTDGNGQASVRMTVRNGVPSGSYNVVAYTSPASAGPNAEGYGRFYVTRGEVVSEPRLSGGISGPDACTAPCIGVDVPASFNFSGSTSSLGNPIASYSLDCGNGTPIITSLPGPWNCTYTAATTYVVTGWATSSSGVNSTETTMQVTATDIP